MRKGCDGGDMGKKNRGGKKEIRMKIVATTSLPAVDRLNADRWNAARSRQKLMKNTASQNASQNIFKRFQPLNYT